MPAMGFCNYVHFGLATLSIFGLQLCPFLSYNKQYNLKGRKKMFKKILNLTWLVLMMLLVFSSMVYAKSDSENPFESFDKTYEERLKTAKDLPDLQFLMQSRASADELQRKEIDALKVLGERYIVKFNDKASMEEIFDVVSLYNYEILGKSENRLFMLEIVDVVSFKEQASEIIEFIEEDVMVEVDNVTSDSYYTYQWAMPAIKIPEAWEFTKGSNDVFVAVIDSGIYRNQPDLINIDIRNGWDYIFNEYCDWDSTGHGTNVIGIIGAETNNVEGIAGVNWNVAIIPLRVADSSGAIYNSDTIEAIYDAAYLECDVINLSLGGPSYSSAEASAINYAISKGCIVVASAGNDGSTVYNYPASYNDVISVGSIDSNLQVSFFSQHNNKVDVTAPGENIFTTSYWIYDSYGNDYAFVDGTSFSAPYVSGIAALMSAVKPSITAGEFMDILKVTSTDLGYTGYDNYYGYGLINAEKMLQSISTIQVQSVNLNKNSIVLNIGDSEKLNATILPSNATNQNVNWISNNPSVVTVNNGIITAVGNGTSIITVITQDGNKAAQCTVTVKLPIPVMEGEGDHFYKNDCTLAYSSNQVRADVIARNHVRALPELFLIKVNGELYNLVDANAAYAEDPDNWKTILIERYGSEKTINGTIEEGLAGDTLLVEVIDASKIDKVTYNGRILNYANWEYGIDGNVVRIPINEEINKITITIDGIEYKVVVQ